MDAQICTEQARAVAAQFAKGEFAQVASAGHVKSAFGLCWPSLILSF